MQTCVTSSLDNASSSTAFTPPKQTEVLQCIILQVQSEFSNQPRSNMQTSDPCPGLKYRKNSI